MPSIYDVDPGGWVTAKQFHPGEEKTYTIKDWEMGEFKDKTGKVKKSVQLMFEETEAKLGLINEANKFAFDKMFPDIDKARGRQITLFTILVKQETQADGSVQDVRGIRIKKPIEILQKAVG